MVFTQKSDHTMFATLFALWRLGIAPWSPVVRANGRAVSSCPDNLQKNPETAAIFGRYSHPRGRYSRGRIVPGQHDALSVAEMAAATGWARVWVCRGRARLGLMSPAASRNTLRS